MLPATVVLADFPKRSDLIVILDSLHEPTDLRALPETELAAVADELRQTIITTVAENGGHLASNCGAVELTVALHRVFNTPAEKIFFDVGHQSYAHKILTGRRKKFASLRKINGISGFPAPEESPFDPAPAGHAGTALSLALGAAAAQPDSAERVIAVVGDGCVGCGVTLEALNNISGTPGKERLILVINDNQMSISRNVGALSRYLGKVISGSMYNRFRSRFKSRLERRPKLFQLVRRMVYRIKKLLMPVKGNFFETLGLRYVGPVDGHDLKKLISVFTQLRASGGPVVLHVVTSKGAGCSFAEADPTRYHGIAGCDPEDGTLPESSPGFSKAFGNAMVKLGEADSRIVAVSAAMLEGTGLKNFAAQFPERTFDTGIAEEHAVTFAASLAANGKLPVCAIYDTFLQRALDGIYHDGILAQVPLVIAADRAGAVEDGATHHGIYNCSFLRSVPGLTVAAPATCDEVEKYLEFAFSLKHPVVIRYPRGGVKPYELPEFPALELGKAALIRKSDDENAVVIWSFGAELVTALETADILEKSGIHTTVVDARFLKPFDKTLARSLAKFRQFTIENHSISGGLYSALTESCADIAHAPITGFGWPDDEIIGHGEVGKLREKYGLTARLIAEKICAVNSYLP